MKLLVAGAIVLIAWGIAELGGGSGTADEWSGRVVSVADGDTLSVRRPSGKVERVRLIGIDTPEVHGQVECGGPEASAEMKRLADRGSKVTVSTDPTQDSRDRYERVLGYVERDGDDLGLAMVRQGLAAVYVFDRRFKRYGEYRQAERQARSAGRGAWARCDISR